MSTTGYKRATQQCAAGSLTLRDAVLSYGPNAAVACIEVTNGISAGTQTLKEMEVRSAKTFLTQNLPEHVRVIGGFAFIKNYGARERELGENIDFSIHISDYDPARYRRSVESVAEYIPCENQSNRWTLPTPEEKELVKYAIALSDRESVPLHHFFDIHRRRFWKTISPYLSRVTTSRKYIEAIKKPRGQIMEQYVGRTFRQHLPEGEVWLNYAFPVAAGGPRIDADNLVIAPSLDALVDTLQSVDAHEKAAIRLAESFCAAFRKAA